MNQKNNYLYQLLRLTSFFLLVSGCIWAQNQSSGAASANPTGSNGDASTPAASTQINNQPAGSGWRQQFFWLEGAQFSSNHYGQIWLINNAVGFHLTKRFSVAVGLPFYNVSSSQGSVHGLGDVFGELELLTGLPLGQLTTSLTVTAPTGNKSAGLSSGHATVDFTNGLTHRWGAVGLFGSAGIADSIANTAYFVRPVSSYGWVGHFEAGGELFPHSHIGLGAAAYDILPVGSQTVYQRGNGMGNVLGGLTGGGMGSGGGMGGGMLGGNSNGKSGAKSTGNSSLDRDNGGAVWLDVSPVRPVNLEISYSRSVHYGLNTFAVSINSNLWQLLTRNY